MKKMLKIISDKFYGSLGYAMGLGIFFASQNAEAAGDAVKFGQIGSNLGEAATGLGGGAYKIAMFVGLILAIVGVVMIVAANKRHESPVPGIIFIIGGALMTSISALIGSGSATVFGNNASLTGLNAIGVQ